MNSAWTLLSHSLERVTDVWWNFLWLIVPVVVPVVSFGVFILLENQLTVAVAFTVSL